MDSCCATLSTNVSIKPSLRIRDSAFLGKSIKASPQKATHLNIRSKNTATSRPGLVRSILKPDSHQYIKKFELPRLITPKADPKSVVSIIWGGDAGTRLFPLTSKRSKPAVPVGGCYRLIDIPLSNCINSGINKIFVLTQFNSFSLNRHISRAYNLGNDAHHWGGSVEVLAAMQTPGEIGKNWFRGAAGALRQFIWLIEDAKKKNIENILVLSRDHLYRMDYMDFVQRHVDTKADITVSCVPIEESRASDFELMKINHKGRVTEFEIKGFQELKEMKVDTTVLGHSRHEAQKHPYITSMGIYVFKIDVLLNLLTEKYSRCHEFEYGIIPLAVHEHNVQAYLFTGYWEDIGTIKSFFNANLALTEQDPKFQFYDPKMPFYTSPRSLPPSRIEKCRVVDSIISHGSLLRECSVQHSIVGVRSRLESGVELQDTLMMGADDYESDSQIASLLAEGKIPIGVGENTQIRNSIIDKNARIGRDVVIVNADSVNEADRTNEGFYIKSGIPIVLKNATIKDGTVI